MTNDRKAGVQKAIENFIRRQDKKAAGPTRRNGKPEKEVERDCMAWCRLHNWSMQVYESKNKFVNGRWQSAGLKAGNADAHGSTDLGFAAFVEFKAPGKRGSFWRPKNIRQQQFLLDKINANAFAVVVDSREMLAAFYAGWLVKRALSPDAARQYLLECLPVKKKEPEGSDALGLATET